MDGQELPGEALRLEGFQPLRECAKIDRREWLPDESPRIDRACSLERVRPERIDRTAVSQQLLDLFGG